MAATEHPDKSHLEKQVEELRAVAEKSGLSSTAITACISQALSEELTSTGSATSSAGDVAPSETTGKNTSEDASGTLTSSISLKKVTSHESVTRRRRCAIVAMTVLALFGTVYMIGSLEIGVLMILYDNVLWYLRLATLPIHRVVNISAYHNYDCVVNNPFYNAFDTNCAACRSRKIKVTNSSSIPNVLRIPVLYKGMASRSVSFRDVQQMVGENREDLDLPTMHFKSTVPWMRSAVDLGQSDLEERILADKEYHSEWSTEELVAGRLLRQLFHRPPFVPLRSEICLARTVLVDGPMAKSYFPMGGRCYNTILVAGEGSWEGWLHPPSSCTGQCEPLPFHLETQDILAFPTEQYYLQLKPTGAGVGVALLMSSM